jgi:hypothetical protein
MIILNMLLSSVHNFRGSGKFGILLRTVTDRAGTIRIAESKHLLRSNEFFERVEQPLMKFARNFFIAWRAA